MKTKRSGTWSDSLLVSRHPTPSHPILSYPTPDAVRVPGHGQPAGLLPADGATHGAGRGDAGDPEPDAPRRVHPADLQHSQERRQRLRESI